MVKIEGNSGKKLKNPSQEKSQFSFSFSAENFVLFSVSIEEKKKWKIIMQSEC